MNLHGRYKLEVIADSSGKWVSNQLRFDSQGDALAYGRDLAWRWTAVRKIRVYDTQVDAPVAQEEWMNR